MNRFDIESVLIWVERNLERADKKGDIDTGAIDGQISRLYSENDRGEANPAEVQELQRLIESQL